MSKTNFPYRPRDPEILDHIKVLAEIRSDTIGVPVSVNAYIDWVLTEHVNDMQSQENTGYKKRK